MHFFTLCSLSSEWKRKEILLLLSTGFSVRNQSVHSGEAEWKGARETRPSVPPQELLSHNRIHWGSPFSQAAHRRHPPCPSVLPACETCSSVERRAGEASERMEACKREREREQEKTERREQQQQQRKGPRLRRLIHWCPDPASPSHPLSVQHQPVSLVRR